MSTIEEIRTVTNAAETIRKSQEAIMRDLEKAQNAAREAMLDAQVNYHCAKIRIDIRKAAMNGARHIDFSFNGESDSRTNKKVQNILKSEGYFMQKLQTYSGGIEVYRISW
jgi:hypothetical protein